MSKINDGDAAFPTARVTLNGETAIEGVECYGPGMSLRQWYAGQALAAFGASFLNSGWHNPNDYQIGEVARGAFRIADAMLAASALPSNQEQEKRG
ncbi:hypothetical protein [Pararhizobium sp.]|uniref:hypothetical protein n=1 Tax=Pararhizobium sp. TaxID=1977563 RepID=UPI00271CEC1E|nr:hypothetical protein [Pararhizobium sp.]MDO9416992.1 hypothetical protein [Pararhizobium sp.]